MVSSNPVNFYLKLRQNLPNLFNFRRERGGAVGSGTALQTGSLRRLIANQVFDIIH
jgi:hypothetical protein